VPSNSLMNTLLEIVSSTDANSVGVCRTLVEMESSIVAESSVSENVLLNI